MVEIIGIIIYAQLSSKLIPGVDDSKYEALYPGLLATLEQFDVGFQFINIPKVIDKNPD